MVNYQLDFGELPENRNPEEVFVYLEAQVRSQYERYSRNDREHNMNENGTYRGSYDPEHQYVSQITAILDVLGLDIGVSDISEILTGTSTTIDMEFQAFQQKVIYAITRFSVRRALGAVGTAGTVIAISSDYKEKIGSLLGKIRKIVDQEIQDIAKRDTIFTKIAALQREVDRDRTTVDTLFRCALDLTQTLGECAKNLKPLLDTADQLKKLIWESSKPVQSLPMTNPSKLIETRPDKCEPDIDENEDDIGSNPT